MACCCSRANTCAKLRELTRAHGAVLIFDEVITGFRFGYHGYDKLLGIEPDLTTLGKIVGGGMPVAAVLGRRELLEQLAPLGPVYQAGTMAGNPVCLAAGIATLTELAEGGVYRHLEMLGRHLDAAFARHALKAYGAVAARRSDRLAIFRCGGGVAGGGIVDHGGAVERISPALSRLAVARRVPAAVGLRSVFPVRGSHHGGYR